MHEACLRARHAPLAPLHRADINSNRHRGKMNRGMKADFGNTSVKVSNCSFETTRLKQVKEWDYSGEKTGN